VTARHAPGVARAPSDRSRSVGTRIGQQLEQPPGYDLPREAEPVLYPAALLGLGDRGERIGQPVDLRLIVAIDLERDRLVEHADPLGVGHIAGFARPGGNITGIAGAASRELPAKSLQLLKDAFPHIARVAVLWNAANPVKVREWREVQQAAPLLGVALQSHEVRTSDELAGAFAAMPMQRPDALLVLPDPLLLHSRASIAAFAGRERLPAITSVREYVDAGLLMHHGPSTADGYRRAAGYVAKILKGAKPADLPVEQPSRFEIIVNLSAAKALGLKIPPTLLDRADEVIE
jgi:putative ABC transport system substrate-binding protein